MKHEVQIKQEKTTSFYLTPDVNVWSVEAEQGFAVSNPSADTGDLPGLDDNESWS